MSVYQYAKSTDPDVIRVALANRDGRNDLMRRAMAWAKERGNETAYYNGSFGITGVTGLPKQPEGRGRWTCRRGAWRPFKNNRAEHAALEALTFRDEQIPGLPHLVIGHANPDWSRPFMTPRPFVLDGVAYLGLSSAPDPGEQENREGYGPQWVEILASEFHAAHETVTGKKVAS